MGSLHHQGTWAWPGLSQFCAGCTVLQADAHLQGQSCPWAPQVLTPRSLWSQRAQRAGGKQHRAVSTSYPSCPRLVCAGPVPSPCPKALLGLSSALGSLPRDGQRCQVPVKSLGLPAASPGRWLERERQRCLPGLVSFVKAPAAGMSQDLLSPSETRRKGLCVQLPWAGLCGQQCPSVLPLPLGASWERSIEEWGEILAAVQRLRGLQRSGEGDTVLVWRLRR